MQGRTDERIMSRTKLHMGYAVQVGGDCRSSDYENLLPMPTGIKSLLYF